MSESEVAAITAGMEQASREESITDMEILAKLLEKRNIDLHTTIHNPLAMTSIDQGLLLIKKEFGSDMYAFCKKWVDMYRVNMVAEDGNRATRLMQAVAAKQEENKKITAADKLLGDLNR